MAFQHEEPGRTYGAHGVFAYHYTTSQCAFDAILATRLLKFSPLANLRDPVENKDWVQILFTGLSWSREHVETFEALTRQVLYDTKVLSFTLDASLDEHPTPHARGCARPRMWEQYGDNHEGVCLVFDHADLREQFIADQVRHGRLLDQEIIYSDRPLSHHEHARSLNPTNLAVVGEGDISRGLLKHVEQHAEELFFRKLSDWSTEREYRYVLLDSGPDDVYVEFGDSLRAVIVGERFPRWQLPAAAAACAEAGVDFRQIRWGAFPPTVFDPLGSSVSV